jgi:hypothetical protein
MRPEIRPLENVIAAGFAGVAFALVATFPASEPGLFAGQLLAAFIPAIALLRNRRERLSSEPRTELATDGSGTPVGSYLPADVEQRDGGEP